MHDIQRLGAAAPQQARRELEARAAALKVASTSHATAAIQMAREACGGAGYLGENRLPALKADTDVFTTFEGDNTVLLQLVAKGLLTEFQESFGDLQTLGWIRFGSRLFADSVLERTSTYSLVSRIVKAAPSRDSDNAELDRGRQLELVLDRERHLLEGVALRLQKGTRSGAGQFAVFNAAQDHLVGAARPTSTESSSTPSSQPSTRVPTLRPGLSSTGSVSLCPEHHRGEPGLVPGARPALPRPFQGRRRRREPALRGAAVDGPRPRRRVRDQRQVAGHPAPRAAHRLSPPDLRPPTRRRMPWGVLTSRQPTRGSRR